MVPEIRDFDHDENKIAAVNAVNRRDQGVFLPAVKAGRHFAQRAKAENIPDVGKTLRLSRLKPGRTCELAVMVS